MSSPYPFLLGTYCLMCTFGQWADIIPAFSHCRFCFSSKIVIHDIIDPKSIFEQYSTLASLRTGTNRSKIICLVLLTNLTTDKSDYYSKQHDSNDLFWKWFEFDFWINFVEIAKENLDHCCFRKSLYFVISKSFRLFRTWPFWSSFFVLSSALGYWEELN